VHTQADSPAKGTAGSLTEQDQKRIDDAPKFCVDVGIDEWEKAVSDRVADCLTNSTFERLFRQRAAIAGFSRTRPRRFSMERTSSSTRSSVETAAGLPASSAEIESYGPLLGSSLSGCLFLSLTRRPLSLLAACR
jgi:hypothetical protein